MKPFMFLPRNTRSGAVFSPFYADDASFNLSEALRVSAEQEAHQQEAAGEQCQRNSSPAEDAPFSPSEAPVAGKQHQRSSPAAEDVEDALLSLEPREGGDVGGLGPGPALPTGAPPKRPQSPPAAPPPKRLAGKQAPAKGKGPNERVHRKRLLRRDAEARRCGHHAPRPEVIAACVKDAPSIGVGLRAEDLPATSSGYTARSKQPGEGIFFHSLQGLLDDGYRLVEWDGITCMPIVDAEGRIFSCLVGRPSNDPSYLESCRLAYEAITDEGRAASFSPTETNHRRGNFPAVNIGVTMGLGATYPTNLSGGAHAEMVGRLLRNEHIIRLASFADAGFALWAPGVHKYYRDHLGSLFERLPHLQHIFPRAVFPAAAFNFGPNVWTKSHRDCRNSAVGWCAIQALGQFDSKKGGHLVLPDLKIVVEFPPGSLILIPSATLTHGNLPVQEGSRISFTLYCCGGLFQYVENGFRTENELKRVDPKEYKRRRALKAMRWNVYLNMYSSLHDFVRPM